MQQTIKSDYHQIKKRLHELGASKFQLDKSEIRQLPHILMPDETIESFIFGIYEAGSGMLVATDQRIVFVDKRIIGLKVEDIPYATINSVEYSLGIFFGTVKLFTRAENFVFRWVRKPSVGHFCDFVDKEMLQFQSLKEEQLEKSTNILK